MTTKSDKEDAFHQDHPIMKLGLSSNWLSADVQTRIEPPPIPLTSPEEVQERACDTIKVKIKYNPASAGSETHEFKIAIFDNDSPEELLQFLTNAKKAIKRTGTKKFSGRINFLRTLLRGEALGEFDILASQKNGMTNTHYNYIKGGLLEYFTPYNTLTNKKRAMCRYLKKPRILTMKRLATRLTELNNCLPFFPCSDASKKMEEQELNEILLHTVLN